MGQMAGYPELLLPSVRARSNINLITVSDSASAILQLDRAIFSVEHRTNLKRRNTNISVSAAMSTVHVYSVAFVVSNVLSFTKVFDYECC